MSERDEDAPPVRPWSERQERALPHHRPPQRYESFRDYFDDVIAPTLGQREPEVQLGYPHLKRRG